MEPTSVPLPPLPPHAPTPPTPRAAPSLARTFIQQNKKLVLLGAALLLGLAGTIIFFALRPSVIAKDTTIRGNWEIIDGDTLTLKNDAVLTVTGDATIDGVLDCSQGGITLLVRGTLTVHGRVQCLTSGAAIRLVSPHIETTEGSSIIARGSIALTPDTAPSADDMAVRWSHVGSRPGAHIGPFQEGTPTDDTSLSSPVAGSSATLAGTFRIGDEERLIDGSRLAAPDPGTPALFALVDGFATVTLPSWTLHAGPAGNGQDGPITCDTQGAEGADGLRVLVGGGTIAITTTEISLGGGGNGGNATTDTACATAHAQGGRGGRSGNVAFSALQTITVKDLSLSTGKGGNGGNATATGGGQTPACPAVDGGSSRAQGGTGGAGAGTFFLRGVTDTKQIFIGRVTGGDGGDATATGGAGSDGNTCGCPGGNGGDTESLGGNGGDALTTAPDRSLESHGGQGGDATATATNGGNGGSCTEQKPGGVGGNGGNTTTRTGRGGSGGTGAGRDGIVSKATGGNGGAGGNGCAAGMGGKAGVGSPQGKDGLDGTPTCEGGSARASSTGSVDFFGVVISTEQLRLVTDTACRAPYWVAKRDTLTDIRGTDVTLENSPVCGLGTIEEHPIQN